MNQENNEVKPQSMGILSGEIHYIEVDGRIIVNGPAPHQPDGYEYADIQYVGYGMFEVVKPGKNPELFGPAAIYTVKFYMPAPSPGEPMSVQQQVEEPVVDQSPDHAEMPVNQGPVVIPDEMPVVPTDQKRLDQQ